LYITIAVAIGGILLVIIPEIYGRWPRVRCGRPKSNTATDLGVVYLDWHLAKVARMTRQLFRRKIQEDLIVDPWAHDHDFEIDSVHDDAEIAVIFTWKI
jgi:hypothetical protein